MKTKFKKYDFNQTEKIYHRLKSSKSNADADILKDVPRTFPDNPYFQDVLFFFKCFEIYLKKEQKKSTKII